MRLLIYSTIAGALSAKVGNWLLTLRHYEHPNVLHFLVFMVFMLTAIRMIPSEKA